MKERSLYSVVPHQSVETFVHTDVQGEHVPTDETPFEADATHTFAVVGNEKKRVRGSADKYRLRRISELHGRSYAFPWQLLWRDRYGNLFSALNGKGNNCTELEAFTSNVSPSGFAVRGLQDSDSLVRLLRASDYLRSKNVPTEMVVHVLEPATLPIEGEMIPLAQVKQKLVEIVLRQNTEGNRNEDTPTLKDISRLTQALRNMTFFITIRGMQANERIGDLAHAKTTDDLKQLLQPAMQFVNMETRLQGGSQTTLSPDVPEDIERYLEEVLPLRCARTFASMHEAGVTLQFTHTGNISLTGSICDLDSAKGEPLKLGDEIQQKNNFIRDIREFLRGM